MFTGIITHTAIVHGREERGGGARFIFQLDDEALKGIAEGESISVSGVCLTAVNIRDNRFSADVSMETLSKTTLGSWVPGRKVNIEFSLKLHDRLGGHLVSGHVDGRSSLVSKLEEGESWRYVFQIPGGLEKYVARKGSVCLDGVSLTVNTVARDSFSVCIIPHTLEITTLGELAPGQEVNLEIDLIARYLERLQTQQESHP